ncbi:MAG: hypothetical protein WBO06_04080 [Gammaproteobacteria bacterium]
MKSIDPILCVLIGLLLVSLAAFFLGLIPYPLGLLVLLAFIVARLLTLHK